MVDGIALLKLVELIFRWLTGEKGLAPAEVAASLWSDYIRPGRHGDKPPRWLSPHLPARTGSPHPAGARTLPARQARHVLPPAADAAP
jgi:hypothetical protein